MAFSKDRILPIAVTTAILAGVAYFIATAKGPCESAIPFRIGRVDPRFHISREQLQRAAIEASAVWGTAAHPALFAYDPRAELTVNLVFDWRQQNTQTGLAEIARIKTLHASLESMEAELGPRRAALERSGRELSRQFERHNARVDRWNRSRGADGSRDEILGEQRDLEQKQRALVRERDSFNTLIGRHNDLVEDMNARIETLNRDILNGASFEKGLYRSRSGGKPQIDIFQFEEIADLMLTLAHEFGHALGLPHGANPRSLMFPYILNQKRQLSPEDRKLLGAYCST